MADLSQQCCLAFAKGRKEDALILLGKLKVDQQLQDLVCCAAEHGWVDIV